MAKVKNFFGANMFKKFLNSRLATSLVFCVLAFLAGGLNAFVGTGGGILIVFALSVVLGVDKKDALATSLCITIPVSFFALFSYFKAGSVDNSMVFTLFLPVLAGGVCGAFLLDRLRLFWLNAIFGVLVFYSGTRLIWG